MAIKRYRRYEIRVEKKKGAYAMFGNFPIGSIQFPISYISRNYEGHLLISADGSEVIYKKAFRIRPMEQIRLPEPDENWLYSL